MKTNILMLLKHLVDIEIGKKIVPKFLKKIEPLSGYSEFLNDRVSNEWRTSPRNGSNIHSSCHYRCRSVWTDPQSLASFTHIVNVTIFVPFQKWVQCTFMVMFTRNVKNIKGAAHRNYDVDRTSKRTFVTRFSHIFVSKAVFTRYSIGCSIHYLCTSQCSHWH